MRRDLPSSQWRNELFIKFVAHFCSCMASLKSLQLCALICFFYITIPVSAHTDYWRISGKAYEDEAGVSVEIFASLGRLQLELKSPVHLDDGLYYPRLQKKFLQEFAELAPELIELSFDGQLISPFVKRIDIQQSSSVLSDDERQSAEAKGVEPNQVDVVLELFFPFKSKPKKIAGKWTLYPQDYLKALGLDACKMPDSARVVKFNVFSKQHYLFTLQQKKAEFTWETDAQADAYHLPLCEFDSFVKTDSIWLFVARSTVLFGLLLCWWCFVPQRAGRIGVFAGAMLFVGLVYVQLNSEREYKLPRLQNDVRLKVFVERALIDIYHSANNATSKNQVWQGLKHSLSEKYREDLYVELNDGFSDVPGQQRLLEGLELLELKLDARGEVRCRWKVWGLVRHKAHLHSREFYFNGRLRFSPNGFFWQLADIELIRDFSAREQSLGK